MQTNQYNNTSYSKELYNRHKTLLENQEARVIHKKYKEAKEIITNPNLICMKSYTDAMQIIEDEEFKNIYLSYEEAKNFIALADAIIQDPYFVSNK